MKHENKSDLEKYIAKRKAKEPKFAKNFEEGWEVFRLAAMLAAAREDAGLSQEELAIRVGTKRSNVCRWERQPTNMTLGTLSRIATALGKTAQIALKSM